MSYQVHSDRSISSPHRLLRTTMNVLLARRLVRPDVLRRAISTSPVFFDAVSAYDVRALAELAHVSLHLRRSPTAMAPRVHVVPPSPTRAD